MQNYLDQHPDIFLADDELHYFGKDISFRDHPLSRKDYLHRFEDVENEDHVGEKSTWYLYSDQAAREIKQFQSKAKIIIHLRNPVDLIHSLHHHLVNHSKREPIKNLGAAIEAESERKAGRNIPDSARFADHYFYTEIPRYYEQIRRYHDAFDPENIHFVIFEEFISNTQEIYRETLNFLGADNQFKPSFDPVNQARGTRSQLLKSVRQSRILRKTLNQVLPEPLQSRLYETLKKINTRSGKTPMNKELKRKLQKEFIEEIEKVESLINHDLSLWKHET